MPPLQRTRVQFPVPTLDGPQSPVTPDPMPLTSGTISTLVQTLLQIQNWNYNKSFFYKERLQRLTVLQELIKQVRSRRTEPGGVWGSPLSPTQTEAATRVLPVGRILHHRRLISEVFQLSDTPTWIYSKLSSLY